MGTVKWSHLIILVVVLFILYWLWVEYGDKLTGPGKLPGSETRDPSIQPTKGTRVN